MKFRKKPVVIEAIQYTGHNDFELSNWSNGAIVGSPVLEPADDNPTGAYTQISTLEGVMTASVGDWIIKGVAGEFYPCKPDIFKKTYQLADESPDEGGWPTYEEIKEGWQKSPAIEYTYFGVWKAAIEWLQSYKSKQSNKKP